MKKILIKYDKFSEDLSMSQAIKFISYKYLDIDFYIEGAPENTSIFKGFSKNIKVISAEAEFDELRDKNELITISLDECDGLVDTDSSYSFENAFNIFKSFNKKFAIFTNSNNNFSEFLAFNENVKEQYFLMENDTLTSNENLTNNEYFGGIKKIEDIFYDETQLYVVSKRYFELFNTFLIAISNYFLKRYQEKTTKTGFARFAQNLFKWGSTDEIGTLFQDLTYYFTICIKGPQIFLLIKEKYKTNDIIKGLNVLCSLLNGKFDLINK